LTIGESNLPQVKVHATAVFGMLNSFGRRPPKQERVIGTLLGRVREGVIEVRINIFKIFCRFPNAAIKPKITDCFGVPHLEKTDELYVAINKDYHKSMYNFHRLINRREQIVGWYTTTMPDGRQILDSSTLIHEFYSDECNNPVHIVLDTTLAGDSVGIRAYFSQPMMVGDYAFANMFNEVKVDIALTDAETTCLYHMIRGQDEPWESTAVVSKIQNESTSLRISMENLVALID